MSPVTKGDIEEIVGVWLRILNLAHWNVTIAWDVPVDLGIDAEIKIHADYEQASIRIQQQSAPVDDEADRGPTVPYSEWTPYKAHHVIVHELLHIFEKQTARAVQSVESALPKAAYEVLWAWYGHGSENWVDRLAQVLVGMYGLSELEGA